MCAFHAARQQRVLNQNLDVLGTFKNSLRSNAPWDSIVEFATSDKYCNKRLYPRQQTLLRLIFLETEQMSDYDLDVINQWANGFKKRKDVFGVQPDIWDRVEYLKSRGYRRFPHILSVLGRRASKGMIGGVLGAEQTAYYFSLDDWQAHYGVDPGQDGYLSVVATNQSQAQRFQFADIRRTIEGCKYLQPHIATSKEYYFSIRTPADVRRIAELKSAGITIEREIATLRGIALSSNSSSGRGAVGFANFFDEFAFMIQGTGSSKSGEEIYEAWQPSLDQFGRDALTYIPSSPFSKIGKFFELYKQGSVLMESYSEKHGKTMSLETEGTLGIDAEGEIEEITADPEMLVFQGPSWVLYQDWEKSPELIGVRFKRAPQEDLTSEVQQRRQKRNPEKFKVERLGQFADVQDAYLDPDKVDEMFVQPDWREPLEPQDYGRFDRVYRIHCDPGRTNANFALAVAHLEDALPDEKGDIWPNVIFDYLKVWKPGDYADNTIDYIQIQDEINEVLRKFPSTSKISFDQWNCQSGDTLVPTEFGLLSLEEMIGDFSEGTVIGLECEVESHHGPAVAREGYHKGHTPIRRLTTKMGNYVEATPEHRLWVRKSKDKPWHADKEWKFDHVSDIEVGDWLCLRRNTILVEKEFDLTKLSRWKFHWKGQDWTPTCDENLGEALGLLVAEGDYKENHVRFGNSEDEVIERYRSLMEKSFGGTWKSQTVDDWKGKYHYGWVRKSGVVPRLLHELGLTGVATEKVVPWVIRRSPREVVQAFLRGYFEGDGGVCFGREGEVWVEATTTSQDLAKVVQQLAISVGVLCTLWEGTYRYRGESRKQWRIKFYGDDLRDFSEKIGFSCSRKQSELQAAISILDGHSGRGIGLRSKNQRHGDEYWVRVSKIEEGEADCYDLSVPGPQTYIANGVVSHNSASFLANIRAEFSPQIRVVEEVFTEKTNQIRCEKFKSALNLGWVKSYLDHYGEGGGCLLEAEMKFLTEKNGKVIKQDFGPVTTKDLFDAVCVVTTDLLHDALDRWISSVATRGSYGSSDIAGLRSGRELERMGAMGSGIDRRGSMVRKMLEDQSIEKARDRMRVSQQGFPSRGRFQSPFSTRGIH